MKTRAKLVCIKVGESTDGHTSNPQKIGERVNFETRYNQNDSPEDNSFSAATPSASMSMWISNPEVFGAFVEGQAYYFDISPVGE